MSGSLSKTSAATNVEAPLARYCAWGKHWFSDEDRDLARAGAMLTHGCCPACTHLFWSPDGPRAA